MSATSTPPAKRRRRILRRLLRRLLQGIGAALLAVVGVLAFVVCTETGTAWVLGIAVRWYDDAIPGHAEVEAIEGSLATTLTLRGVLLRDRDENLLARARVLELDIDYATLKGGVVAVDRIAIAGLEVTANGEWGDLGPESTEPEEPEPEPEPDEGLGPSLPELAVGGLEIDDATVYLLIGGTPTTLVSLSELEVAVSGDGHDARGSLRAANLELPAQQVTIDAFSFAVAWEDPVVRLSELSLAGSPGTIVIAGSRLDASDLGFELDGLDVDVDDQWLHTQVPALPPGLEIGLQASAEQSRPKLVVTASLPHGPNVTAELDGVVTDSEIVVRADVACADCGAPAIDVAARVDAEYDRKDGSLAASFSTHAGTNVVAGTAALAPSGAIHATLAWNAEDLRPLEPLLVTLGAGQAAQGSTSGTAVCAGTLEPRRIACSLQATASLVAGTDASVLAEAAVDGDTIDVDVFELAAKTPRVGLELVDGPAHARIDGERVEVRGFALRDTRGRGRLSVDAVVDLAGHSDVEVRAQGLDVSAVQAFVPGVRADGIVSAELHATGRREDFAIRADVRGRGLAYDGIDIGNLTLVARASPTSASAKVVVRSGLFGKISADATVPLAVGADTIALGPGPIRASLDIDEVELPRLDALVPGFAGRGRVHARARLSGTLARPRLQLDVRGRELAWATHVIGDVDLASHYRSGRVVASVHLDHPSADTVVVDVDVPAHVDLASGRVAWDDRGRHELRVRASSIELAGLREEIGRDVGGRVDVDVALHGRLADPTIDGSVTAQGVTFEGTRLGKASVRLRVEGGHTTLKADAQSPLVDDVKLTVRAPLGIDVLAGRPRWQRTAAHELELELDDVHLAQLAPFVPGVALTGSLDAKVTVRGAPSDPHVVVWVGGEAVAVDDLLLGAVEVDASYGDGTAHVDATAEDGHSTMRVLAMAPVDLDLAAPKVVWTPDRRHELIAEIRGVAYGDVTRSADLPDGLGFRTDADLSASGSIADFDVRASVRTHVDLPGKGPDARVVITAALSENKQRVDLEIHEGKHQRVVGRATTAMNVAAVIDGKADAMDAKLDSHLRVTGVQLARFAELLPIELHDPHGVVGSEIRINGSLHDPRMDGSLRVDRAGVTVVPWQQRLEDISLRLAFSNDRIELPRFTVRSGIGKLDVSGRVDIGKGGLRGHVALKANRFSFRQPPLPSMRLTADIKTSIDLARDRTKIGVKVADSRLEILSLSTTGAKDIPTNPRVRYADTPVAPPAAAAAADAEPQHRLTAKLEIVEPLQVQGPLLNMAWDGGFELDDQPSLRVTGGVKAERGTSTFDLLGTQFTIQRGLVAMNDDGELVPFLDVRGEGTVGTTKVYADISGRVTRPVVHFSSDPPRAELEVITMILTGSDDDVGEDADATAQAATALAAFAAPALQESIGERLGVDTVRLAFGDSLDEPIVSVGKNLNKKVYSEATVHVNAPRLENNIEVMLRYRFVPEWACEVFTGDVRGGVGLWWIRMFDKRPSDGKPDAK